MTRTIALFLAFAIVAAGAAKTEGGSRNRHNLTTLTTRI